MLKLETNSIIEKPSLKLDEATRWNERNVFIIKAAAVLGGSIGAMVGFIFFGPLGAVAGSIAGIAIGRICGETIYRNNLKNREFGVKAAQILVSGTSDIAERQGASEDPKDAAKPTQPKTDSSGCFGINSLMLKSHNTRLISVNLRSFEVKEKKEDFVGRFSAEKQDHIRGERENECLDQIVADTGYPRTLSKRLQALDLARSTNEEPDAFRNLKFLDLACEIDQKRYNTNITADKIEEIIKPANKQTKQNILFANCQNFEISVARVINCEYDTQRYTVMQLPANDKDSTKSTLHMDEKKRTTTLISKLQIYDTFENREIERFKATAVINWDTAETSITINPIIKNKSQ